MSNSANTPLYYSNTILKVFEYFCIIGALLEIVVCLIDTRKTPDLPVDTISACGNLIYTIGLVAFLYFSMMKVKNDGLRRPSSILLTTLIVTSVLGVIADFCSIDQFEDEFTFWNIILIIDLIAFIAAGISYLLNPDTKEIGIWMIIDVIAAIIVAIFISPSGSKGVVFFWLILYVGPTIMMVESFKKFLGDSKEIENHNT